MMIEKNKSFIIITLLYVLVFAINSALTSESDSNDVKTNSTIPKVRVRRYLNFQNGSRILFRVNEKENIIKINQIFAHAYGFRANIDILQPPIAFYPRLKRSVVYETVEQLFIQQGFDGRACIFKMLCDAANVSVEESGMFAKLFKLIFTHKDSADYGGVSIDFLLTKGCKYINDHCPLTSLGLSPYTDI